MSKTERSSAVGRIWRAATCVVVAVAASLLAAVAPVGAAPQSVVLVADILPGTGSGGATNLINVNGTLFFRASDGTGAGAHGSEIWKSDGTAAGTALVKDINPGTASSSAGPTNIANLNGIFMFTATDGTGITLWRSDGTAVNTVKVGATVVTPQTAANFTVIGSTLFFTGTGTAGGGVELWKTDGTDAGTTLVKDINTTTVSAGSSSPSSLANINGTLYFAANDGVNGIEPWTSDGTDPGTTMLKDINPAAGANSSPSQFSLVNGTVYFSASDGTNGSEPWKTDGTSAGTQMLADINPGSANSGPGPFMNANGVLVFPASDTAAPTPHGSELWTSDGTAAGTVLLKDINPGTASSSISFPLKVGNLVFFAATTAANGQELWRTDGTAAGTFLTKDIYPGVNQGVTSFNATSIDFNGTLYFTGIDDLGGFNANREVWKSDGTTAGTVQVYDLVPGGSGSFPTGYANVNGRLFFQASTSATGNELYRLNNGPTATNDSYSTNEDSPLTVSAPGLLTNDTDPDGNLNTLSAAKVTDPAHGSVTVNPNGSFTYTPAANYNGSDSFTYKATDGSLDSVATVNLTVNPVPDAPVANNNSYSTPKNTPMTVTTPGVLGNDTDADGDPLTAAVVSTTSHGILTLNADGSFTYAPNSGFVGSDTFTYKANDGTLDSNVATVTINVTVTTLSASPSSVAAGGQVTATWANIAAPSSTDWVGLYTSSGDAAPAMLAWAYTNGAASGSLNLNVPMAATPSTTYELRLFSNNTYTRLASSSPFTVTASASSVTASPSTVPAGSTVTGTYSGIASPTGTDWIGLYQSSSAPDSALLAWGYTNGTSSGSLGLSVPLTATSGSTYELRLFSNNAYTRLATSSPFTVTASAATIAASPSSVNAGSAVTATWSGIGAPTATDWIGLYGDSAAGNSAPLAWSYTNGNPSGSLPMAVPVSTAAAGTYELRLYANNTYIRLATSSPFTVTASAATISSTQSSVPRGSQVTANWSGIAGPTSTDWVGLYASSADANSAILAWAYTGGTASGSLNLPVSTDDIPGGTYELRLFANNTYTRLATSTPFTVT